MRVFLLASCVVALGCQRVKDEKADYGPEVSRTEINRALARAMAGVSKTSARLGTSVAYQTKRQVDGAGGVADLGSTSIRVVDEVTNAQRRRLHLQVDRRTRAEGGEFKATRAEETLAFDVVGAHQAAPIVTGARVTYHRLRTAEETLPAPAAVASRPDCGLLASCALHVRYVVFDVVATPAGGGDPQKTTLTLGFSNETPYLPHGEGLERFDGALVLECRASTVRLATRHAIVRDCRTLTDFQR